MYVGTLLALDFAILFLVSVGATCGRLTIVPSDRPEFQHPANNKFSTVKLTPSIKAQSHVSAQLVVYPLHPVENSLQ